MGERMVHGRFDEHWRVRIDGRLAWAGAQRLRDAGRILGGPATLGGATARATIVCVDGDPASTLERLRSLLGAANGRSGASALGPVVVGMLLAAGPRRLMEDLQRVIEGLLARQIPRVRTC
jgi:urease accessory protein